MDVLATGNHGKKRPRSADVCVNGPPVKLVKLNPSDCSEPMIADDGCESDTGEPVTLFVLTQEPGAFVKTPVK